MELTDNIVTQEQTEEPVIPDSSALEQPWPQHWLGLKQELEWFKQVLKQRVESYFNGLHLDLKQLPPPELSGNPQCYYTSFVNLHQLTAAERLVLILAWVAEFASDELDIFQSRNKLYELPFAEFGGVHNQNYPGFQPSIQTALFLLAGGDLVQRLSVQYLFTTDGKLFSANLLQASNSPDIKQSIAYNHHRLLQLSPSTRQQLLQGTSAQPKYTIAFPACKLETQFNWGDLILADSTQSQLQEVQLWLKHQATLRAEWGLDKALAPGYKALFYGPSGTGKTLTAALLGKELGLPVYRIDLSQLVSKYIGETKKNLEQIFQVAEQQSWILFFDEADALFGKRTKVSSANDRHANMETGYLLQRIEVCDNLVILASNLKDNIDPAFVRRFQSVILFDNPGINERYQLWQRGFSDQADVSAIDCQKLARQYELSGAEINNVIRYASLMAIEYHQGQISEQDIIKGIRREKYKAGQYV